MVKYKLSNVAKEDLIRIHHYGAKQFGIKQADKYFDSFFLHFELIAQNPLVFESVDFISPRRFNIDIRYKQLKTNHDWMGYQFLVHLL
jgi:plasmid stabilization system protein ParE